MGFVLLSLSAGVALGFFCRNSPRIIKKANLVTLAGLFFLLLVMGAQLGASREVLSSLGLMGKQAFTIALLSVAGSVLSVQLASGFIQKNLELSSSRGKSKAGDGP